MEAFLYLHPPKGKFTYAKAKVKNPAFANALADKCESSSVGRAQPCQG